MTQPNKSGEYSEGNDPLLDDTTSSVNMEILKDHRKSLHIITPYGATKFDDLGTTNYMTNKPLLAEGHEPGQPPRTGTIFSSTLNLSNTVVGAGILGIPLAIKNSGYIMALVLFLIFGSIAAYTMHLTMCAALCVEHASYDALCRATIPKFKKLVDFIIGFASWGVCVAYIVVIGDTMDLAMEQFLENTNQNVEIFGYNTYSLWINRYFWMITYLILFILPTISLKQMDSLKFTSFFALFIFMVLMVMVLCYWTIDELDACHSFESDGNDQITECNEGITPLPSDWQEFFKTIPIFIFAYECHTNLWPIRNEIQNPTPSRLTSVGVNTAIFCTVLGNKCTHISLIARSAA